MTKVILHGCCGRMGKMITELATPDEGVQIVAGVDSHPMGEHEYPVYRNLSEVREKADAIIDFTNASAIDALLDYCEKEKMPVVLCSTGLSEEQIERVKALSGKVAVLRSANMSLGINIVSDLIAKAAKVLAPAGFDVEIVEKHHNKKLDAPLGTALALADSINDAMGGKYEYVYGRADRRAERDKKELGISAVRGGNIVGEHEVIFAGADEVVEIKHTAYSRAIFAKGAITASIFIAKKNAGLYTMADVIAGV